MSNAETYLIYHEQGEENTIGGLAQLVARGYAENE